jgi:hypothetical protein
MKYMAFLAVVLIVSVAAAFSINNVVAIAKVAGEVSISKCSDTDGGMDYFVRGVVTVKKGHMIFSYADYCQKIGKKRHNLVEFYCTSDGKAKSVKYECPGGCSEGMCKSGCRPGYMPFFSHCTCSMTCIKAGFMVRDCARVCPNEQQSGTVGVPGLVSPFEP